MTDVRERICAEISSRMGADRGYRRGEYPYKRMTTLADFQGTFVHGGVHEVRFQVAIEHGELRPAPTTDPLADALAAETRCNAILAELIAAMGVGDIMDGGEVLCNAPLYTDGSALPPDPQHDYLQVEATFLVVYHFVRGDPQTPAAP